MPGSQGWDRETFLRMEKKKSEGFVCSAADEAFSPKQSELGGFDCAKAGYINTAFHHVSFLNTAKEKDHVIFKKQKQMF